MDISIRRAYLLRRIAVTAAGYSIFARIRGLPVGNPFAVGWALDLNPEFTILMRSTGHLFPHGMLFDVGKEEEIPLCISESRKRR